MKLVADFKAPNPAAAATSSQLDEAGGGSGPFLFATGFSEVTATPVCLLTPCQRF